MAEALTCLPLLACEHESGGEGSEKIARSFHKHNTIREGQRILEQKAVQ